MFLFIIYFGDELMLSDGVMSLTQKKGDKLNCLLFWHFLDTYLVCRMIIGCVRLEHIFHSPNKLAGDNILGVHAIQQLLYYLAHSRAAPKVLHGVKLS
jgi:hypothetical protein